MPSDPPRSRFAIESEHDLIGAHISTRGGVCTIFERAGRIGATALALFAKNANQWKNKPYTDEECVRFAELHKASGSPPLLTHAAYLINLAATNEEFYEKAIHGLIDELQRADRLGVPAVVLHPGAHMGAGPQSGIDRLARALDRVHAALPEGRAVTLLETAAGQGSCLGCTFEELGRMRKLVDDPARVGICFDTCHVFAAGYEIRTREGWRRTIDELDRHVGLEHVGAIHLNDSKRPLGSRVDRHQHIGKGEIGLEGFRNVLNEPAFRGIPKVLETPKEIEDKSDRRNLKVLRSLLTRSAS